MSKHLKELIADLEKDIEKYCGDYGTLENRLEDTLWKIINILKIMSEDKTITLNNEITINGKKVIEALKDSDKECRISSLY